MNKYPWGGQATLNDATVVEIKAARNATAVIYVTKITISILTHAAKFVAVQDDSGTPVVIAKHTDAAAASNDDVLRSDITYDFGWRGIKLAAGKNLDCVSEASGVAGIVYAEGYEIA
jgi:hypothetical protein